MSYALVHLILAYLINIFVFRYVLTGISYKYTKHWIYTVEIESHIRLYAFAAICRLSERLQK